MAFFAVLKTFFILISLHHNSTSSAFEYHRNLIAGDQESSYPIHISVGNTYGPAPSPSPFLSPSPSPFPSPSPSPSASFSPPPKSSLVPALFVIGDSSVDCGTNNVLGTFARADRLPYGRDFDTHEPTGRFCNGRIPVDYLGNYFDFLDIIMFFFL